MRSQRSDRRFGALLAVVAVTTLAFTATVAVQATARFVDAAAVPANAFSTGTWCTGVQVATVQRGTATSTTSGTTTVTLGTAVDPSASVLWFSARSNRNEPRGSLVRGRINAAGTAVEFGRSTNDGQSVSVNVQWHVVHYACGVKVQRGAVTQSTATTDVPIAAVDLSRSYATFSKTPGPGDTTWSSTESVVARLTSSTSLRLQAQAADATATIWWQVVEYTVAGSAAVQRGTTTGLNSTSATTTTVTLPTAVDTSKSFVLVSQRHDNGTDIGAYRIRARLTGSNTLVIDRTTPGSNRTIPEIAWTVVQLNDGTTVRHGTTRTNSGQSTATATIASVNVSRSVTFVSAQDGAGLSMGRGTYTSDDLVGATQAVVELTSATQITLRRNNTEGDSDFGWFVLTFPTP